MIGVADRYAPRMRVGVLTGGGDCPGLNAVIRAVVRVGRARYGHEHLGLRNGWRGLLERTTTPLDLDAVSGILPRGGTILGTSRTNPFKDDGGGARCAASFRELDLDALVAIGGEDTLGVAAKLTAQFDVPCVGVPKTIDNDLDGTDYTFGFDTAVQIATDAIDRLHTTAESHDRVIVVEVMGRHAGWIATYAGIAGGADVILIPEVPMTSTRCAAAIESRHARGKNFSIVVVSEGFELEGDGRGGRARRVRPRAAREGRDRRAGRRRASRSARAFDTRVAVLGHIQRGGTPNAYDRILATRFGTRAAELVGEGRFGRMVALRGDDIVDIPIAEGVAKLKTVPPERFAIAETFFG